MRHHIFFALAVAVALAVTFHAGKKPRFTFAQVQQMAQDAASKPYEAPLDVLPPQLKKLTPQQEQGIFWNDTYRLWRKKGLPFQVDFYPLANDVHTAAEINTVDRHGAHLLAYSPTFFHFNVPGLGPLPKDLGYGGFYLRYPHMAPKSDPKLPLDGFFTVKGASYFRVIARGQIYGLSARALAINTIVENKEEFPRFTKWWLFQPDGNASSMVLDALLDSPSVSGAYEFTLHPGSHTSVDIHASLFFRKAVSQLGLAPFSSMYFFGENAKNHFGDYHPEIHDSDGVLMNSGKGEWIWRPLEQATQRQTFGFADENPHGFGLLQRDRDFQHYQDLQMNYNLRPSAWVTPHGDWGRGTIQLIQLVTNNTNTDNVVVFWHPDSTPKAGDHLDLDYTINFYMNDANLPPLAYAKQTLVNDPAPPPPGAVFTSGPTPDLPPVPASVNGAVPTPAAKPGVKTASPKSTAGKTPRIYPLPTVKLPPPGPDAVQFLVDFAGHGLEATPANQKPDIELSCAPPGTVIRESSVEKNDYDGSWRVTFTIIPAKVNVPVEMRCSLQRGGKPLSETWTYTWLTPAPGK